MPFGANISKEDLSGTLSVVPQSQGGDSGRVQKTTDPRALISKTDYDLLGQTLRTTANFVAFAPSDSSDAQTEFTYDGSGQVLTRTAKLSYAPLAPVSVETTRYTYGVTRDASCTTNPNSCLNSNDLLASVAYPGQATPLETDAYNALGQTKTKTDPNGSTHQYTFDVLGRTTKDAVTAFTIGVIDTRVLALATAYNGLGLASVFTSYNSATATDPVNNQVNQVQRTFNGLGQLITEAQIHGNSQVTPVNVQYTYSFVLTAGGPNHSRLTSIIYPSSRTVNYNYASGLDDSISRVTSLQDNGAPLPLEVYSYLGLNTVVKRAHPEPGVDLSYINAPGGSSDGGDQYTGLDRFGRILDQYWAQAGTATDNFQYVYDRDSDRLQRNNLLRPAHDFDEVYAYDSFNQLTSFTRNTHSQTWGLDNVGNWKSFSNDQTGPPSETRIQNAQNQITTLTGTGVGTPSYDANGNTLTDEWGHSYSYDAWNRLAQVTLSGSTIVYTYDALGRRLTESGGLGRDLYYSKDWQVLEERLGGLMQYQQVWSPVYVDALVLRDGGLSGRLYVQQDANWNVTGLVNSSGTVLERYTYDPYGKPTVLDPVTWAVRNPGSGAYGTSNYGWVYLHQGGRYTRFDDLSGLYYFRNRDLSPTLGRWIEEDPIDYRFGNNNLYRYLMDSPSKFVDPAGLQEIISTTTEVTVAAGATGVGAGTIAIVAAPLAAAGAIVGVAVYADEIAAWLYPPPPLVDINPKKYPKKFKCCIYSCDDGAPFEATIPAVAICPPVPPLPPRPGVCCKLSTVHPGPCPSRN
jgi:RHS repeat-associated protein